MLRHLADVEQEAPLHPDGFEEHLALSVRESVDQMRR
jgi:hypothetical protein